MLLIAYSGGPEPLTHMNRFCCIILRTGVTAALEPLNETKKDYEEMVQRWEAIGMRRACLSSVLARMHMCDL